MNDLVVGIRLKADGSGLVGEVKNAQGQVSQFGTSAVNTGRQVKQMSDNVDIASNSFASMRNQAVAIGATIASAFAVRDLISFADQATLMSNKLNDVAEDTQALERSQRALLAVSNETRTDLAASVDLYATLQRNARNLVDTDQELVDIVRTINQSFALSGASAESANAAIIQLSQGLASGTLRGDEFNSVAEQAPEILRAVQKQLGVTKGELREMAAEGKITAQVVVDALTNSADEISRRFNQTSITVEQSLTIAKNNLIDFIGEQDRSLGVSSKLSEAVLTLGNNIDTLADGVAVVAAIMGGRYAGAIISAAIAKGVLVKQTLLAAPAVTGLSAALGVQATRATASTIATNALAVSVRGLNAVMLALGGPVGIAAGAILLKFAFQQEEAAEKTANNRDEVQKLIDKFKELGAQGRAIEIEKITQKEIAARAKLVELQKQYNDEIERQKQANASASPATNQFSGISTAVNDSKALGELQTQIDNVNEELNTFAETKSELFNSTLDVSSINQGISEVTQTLERANATRLNSAIQSYQSEADALNRSLQLKRQVIDGSLSAEEAAIYESLFRQSDAYQEQFDRLEVQIKEHYQKELEEAKGNAELIAQIEQDKTDKLAEIKQAHRDSQRLLGEQFNLEMEQANLGFLEKLEQHISNTTNNFDAMWGSTFDRFAAGMGDAVGSAIVEGQDFGETMKSLARSAIQTVISGLVEIGVKKLALAAIEKTIGASGAAASAATAAATGTAMATAYAPAAAFASLASFGANSAPAMAGIATTVGLAESLSVLGIAHDGIDRVPASHEGTWLLRKDEMVLNPSQADDYRQLATLAQNSTGQNGRQINYSPQISIDARNAVPGMEQRIRAEIETALRQYQAELESDFSNGGPLSQRLNGLAA
ncbi:tape measure protein [Alteromonas sp. AMM-1]|uniref:tape measure protein n=1 Tax=Alteromonas sp. AMM-1 TaxID=3394233 RepID=UPI0039A76F7A